MAIKPVYDKDIYNTAVANYENINSMKPKTSEAVDALSAALGTINAVQMMYRQMGWKDHLNYGDMEIIANQINNAIGVIQNVETRVEDLSSDIFEFWIKGKG